MKPSPSAILEHLRSEEGRKKIRYAGVSVVFVPVGLVLVQVLKSLGLSFTTATLLNAAILTLPNFFANKLYVWKVTSKDNQRTQILIFWVAAMLGTGLAVGLTFLAEQRMGPDASIVDRLMAAVAQLTGYGIVWVARFLILDRWLFKLTHSGREPLPGEEDELHTDVPI